MANANVDDKRLFQAIDEKIQNLGRTNIIIVGRSGAGKSTLINAMFGREVAKANDGSPVTEHITEYPLSGTQVTLVDTRGFEMKEYKTIVDQSDKFIKQRRDSVDRNNHIHVAWMCISGPLRRVEEGEVTVVEMFRQHMPVIIILTQCYDDEDDPFLSHVRNKFQGLKVVPVVAKEKPVRGGSCIPTMGLQELTQITEELLPEAHKVAFIAAQKVDFRARQIKAHSIVAAAASLAAAACAVPVPFADSIMLVPIQAAMITAITSVFGFEMNRSIVVSVLGVWGTSSCMSLGEATAANLLKLIPGVGTIAGCVISASIASTITTTYGEGYVSVLNALFKENNGETPTAELLLLKCKEWKNRESEKNMVAQVNESNIESSSIQVVSPSDST